MIVHAVNTLITPPRLLANRFARAANLPPSSDPIRACAANAGRPEDPVESEDPRDLPQDSLTPVGEVEQISGIVCGTDFSIHAREGADVAATLASKFNNSLTLAHIVFCTRGDVTSKTLNAILRYKRRNRLKHEAEQRSGDCAWARYPAVFCGKRL